MRKRRSNPEIMHRAGALRKQPTPAEARLWTRLQRGQLGGVHFRHQHAIGQYVLDFCSPRQKLVIEVDGNPHQGHEQTVAGSARTTFLISQGYRISRFWDRRVMDETDTVVAEIRAVLEA